MDVVVYSGVADQACDIPDIAFRRGYMRELVDDGSSGLLVDRLEEAVIDVGRAETLNRSWLRAQAIARFGRDRMVDQYLAAYSEVRTRRR